MSPPLLGAPPVCTVVRAQRQANTTDPLDANDVGQSPDEAPLAAATEDAAEEEPPEASPGSPFTAPGTAGVPLEGTPGANLGQWALAASGAGAALLAASRLLSLQAEKQELAWELTKVL